MRDLRTATFLMMIVTVVFNFFVGRFGLFGEDISQISQDFHTLATPAGYAFAIWGIIDLGLFGYSIWQLSGKSQLAGRKDVNQLLIVNLALNMAWLICFYARETFFSFLIIIAILVSLVMILTALFRAQGETPWWVVAVFEIYTAWISIATIINAAIVLKYDVQFSFSAQQEMLWLFFILTMGAIISFFVQKKKPGFSVFPFVLLWAFIAIHLHHKQQSLDFTFIPLLPLILIVPSIVLELMEILRKNYSNKE